MRRRTKHQVIGRAEPGAFVKRNGPLARTQQDTNEALLVRVAEQCPEQLPADALIAVGGQHESVTELSPAAGRTPRPRHPLKDDQVHHADQAAICFSQPDDPA